MNTLADTPTSGQGRVALFLDFDNTITASDVLDRIIERYSATDRWQRWETDWREGRISTHECLAQQTADLRVERAEMIRFTDDIGIDEGYEPLVSWASANGAPASIVSDNFDLIIRAMLQRRGLPLIPIYANRISFDGDRPRASFPFLDPGCARCAHCKAPHLRRTTDRVRVFVGDGLSDICPALAADVVFAKDSLAAHLTSIARPFRPFRSLTDVLEALRTAVSHV